jgi:hypothetical protein
MMVNVFGRWCADSFFDITDPNYHATWHDEIYKWVRCDHGLTRLRLTQQRSRGDSLSDHGSN